MAKRVKYRKPMRETRKRIAQLLRMAKSDAKHGICHRASALYNEAVGIANRKGVSMKNESFWRMKRLLRNCRQSGGIW